MTKKFGLIAALVAGTALAAGAASAQDVIVGHAAGINGQAVGEILKDFAADTGMQVQGVTLSDTDAGAKMQLAAKTGNAPYDVVLGMGRDIFTLTEGSGIYADIDTSAWDEATLKAMQDAELIGTNYAVSQDLAALLVYGSALKDNSPENWADFFDTEKFPGNRGMASGGLGVPINMEYALIASGVAPDQLYPLDHEAAMAELDRIAGNVVLWDNAPKGIQDLVNGDTVMTWSYAPAAIGALNSGQDITLVSPPGTAVIRGVGVVMAEGPNGVDAGQNFLEWWYRPENQAKYAQLTNYGIVVPSAAVLEQIPEENQAYLPFSGSSPTNYRTLDYDYYTAEGDLGQSNLALTLDQWNQFRAR